MKGNIAVIASLVASIAHFSVEFDFADTQAFSHSLVMGICERFEIKNFSKIDNPDMTSRSEMLKRCVWVFSSRKDTKQGMWATTCRKTLDRPENFSRYMTNDTDPEDHKSRSGVAPWDFRWPNSTLNYLITNNTFVPSEIAILAASMWDLRHNTKMCLNFKDIKDSTRTDDYVNITTYGAWHNCFSRIGRVGGPQILNLSPGCVRQDIATHELMHAFGFYHEQARPDRDDYVKIIYKNVKEGFKPDFNKEPDSIIYGPYDFVSIMHYGNKDFSKNGEDTIEPVDPKNAMPFGGTVMTAEDSHKLMARYKDICST